MSTSPGTKKRGIKKHRPRHVDDGGDSKPRCEKMLEAAALVFSACVGSKGFAPAVSHEKPYKRLMTRGAAAFFKNVP
jgi:hypothetical protein